MGLLDQIIGNSASPRGKPGLGSTVAAGVVLALLVKGVREYQKAHPDAAPGSPQHTGGTINPPGGLGSILGGLAGAGGLGGLLAKFGGAGSLGSLIGQLQQNGLGREAGSWVSNGANEAVQPGNLGEALGSDAVKELEEKTGMSREQLLAVLSRELPDAVHEATPGGRLPNDSELHAITGNPPGSGA